MKNTQNNRVEIIDLARAVCDSFYNLDLGQMTEFAYEVLGQKKHTKYMNEQEIKRYLLGVDDYIKNSSFKQPTVAFDILRGKLKRMNLQFMV